MEFHPAADIFPMMSEPEIKELGKDILKNELKDPIVTYQGKILDGRNRFKACELVGKPAKFIALDADEKFDPVAYSLSANLHRRHLSESQRATVAGRVKPFYEAKARERMEAGTKADPVENLPQGASRARDAAGAALNVSGKSVDHATKVLKHGAPETIAAVEQGSLAVSAASKLVKAVPDKKKQAEIVAKGKAAVSEATKMPAVIATKPAKPKPFDLVRAGDRLRDWLRNELDRWPEEHRKEAIHWITQIVTKEYSKWT